VVRRLILEKGSADDIAAAGRENGMRTLREDGFDKVVHGITSVAEVLRVAGSAKG